MVYPSEKRYRKKTLMTVSLTLNRNTEPKLVSKLESVPNKSRYLKELIKEDILKSQETKDEEELTLEEKEQWLEDNSFITYLNGEMMLSAAATACLMCVDEEELKSNIINGYVAGEFVKQGQKGAKAIRNIYETDEMIEILYKSLSTGK